VIVSILVFQFFSLRSVSVCYFDFNWFVLISSQSFAIEGILFKRGEEAINCYFSVFIQSSKISVIVESLVPIFVVIFFVTIIFAAEFMPTSLQLSLLVDYLYFIVGDISLRFFYNIISLLFFYFGHFKDSFVQCLEIFLLRLFGMFLKLKQFHPLIS